MSPAGTAVLFADAATRQAASITARVAASLRRPVRDDWLAPASGAFHAATAAALTRWQRL